HRRAGILGRRDQAVEAQLRQQGQEEEDAGHAGAEDSPRREAQGAAVGDLGRLRPASVIAITPPGITPATVRREKGGVTPCRHSARKRQTIDFSVETSYPKR